MNIKELIYSYLPNQYMMQLATFNNGQPWCCTVYYVSDDKLNLFWLSLPSRRHSQEIKLNNKVAFAIPVNFIKGEIVVGIQGQGVATKLESSDKYRKIAEEYAHKFNRTKQWVEDFCDNKTEHKLYKLVPELFVLFDEKNFPEQSRQVYSLNEN